MYPIFLRPNIKKELEKIKKKDKVRWMAIDQELEILRNDPYGESILLVDPFYRGFRRAKTGKTRIRFQICEECRLDPSILKNRGCIDCIDIPPNGIQVFDIDLRKSAYKKY